MVMVYQNLIFPRQESLCDSARALLFLARHCSSLPVIARHCSSLLVLARPCSSLLFKASKASKARKESLCDSARVCSSMPVKASKARKESLCDSARAMLFKASKASQCQSRQVRQVRGEREKLNFDKPLP